MGNCLTPQRQLKPSWSLTSKNCFGDTESRLNFTFLGENTKPTCSLRSGLTQLLAMAIEIKRQNNLGVGSFAWAKWLQGGYMGIIEYNSAAQAQSSNIHQEAKVSKWNLKYAQIRSYSHSELQYIWNLCKCSDFNLISWRLHIFM